MTQQEKRQLEKLQRNASVERKSEHEEKIEEVRSRLEYLQRVEFHFSQLIGSILSDELDKSEIEDMAVKYDKIHQLGFSQDGT